MSVVRLANLNDIDQCEQLAWAFFEESPYRSSSYSQDKVTENLRKTIANPTKSVVLVLEENGKLVGMLIGTATESMFSDDVITCELAWYVLPEYRGKSSLKLFDAYEYWSANVVKANLCSMSSLGSERLGKMYERRGYTKLEDSYLRKN